MQIWINGTQHRGIEIRLHPKCNLSDVSEISLQNGADSQVIEPTEGEYDIRILFRKSSLITDPWEYQTKVQATQFKERSTTRELRFPFPDHLTKDSWELCCIHGLGHSFRTPFFGGAIMAYEQREGFLVETYFTNLEIPSGVLELGFVPLGPLALALPQVKERALGLFSDMGREAFLEMARLEEQEKPLTTRFSVLD